MRVIENYYNGNLTDAKCGARKVGYVALFECLRNEYGLPQGEAIIITSYLKGYLGYQEHCNRLNAERNTCPIYRLGGDL